MAREFEIKVSCVLCSTEVRMKVNITDLLSWERGDMHIQDALPYLTAAEREILISGLCNTCFDKHFSEEEI